MDSYTVKAILSAVDKGFTSTMKQAEQTCQSLSDRVKSGLGFPVYGYRVSSFFFAHKWCKRIDSVK